ncbi:hypothetical protein AYO21_00638 [Fonsecaea monophora]|uniref:NWD NACHT-NTPase N-terminal domain-containing protein n=1 Tax=Fonsecaea monophora TaxID=254056 RepID=A0A177FNX8_9EURO|nr:hypothetical protein AYO21_00638 [Fonsecaea monophora]OAG45290.1 hypothetical protein AYO21_00638 [Fonsecaea monophora]
MSQQSASGRIWSQSLTRKKYELTALLALLERKRKKKLNNVSQIPIITLDEAVQNWDLQSFQTALEALAQQFSQKKVPALASKYLYPSLDHVRSFHSGISSATQFEPTAALVWGILLVVIQLSLACGCIFAESIEEIISQLGALQSLLPFLERDLGLYPKIKSVELSLRAIFEDYIDFCLVIVRHLARKPVWALIRNFTSSSLRTTLKKAKDKLKSDVADFGLAVDSAERARAIQIHDALIQSQQLLLRKKSSNIVSDAQSKVQFPFQHMIIARNPDFTAPRH